MTTTVELIYWLNIESKLAKEDDSPIAASRLMDAAKRLIELDKPDCIFTMCSDDSPTPDTLESSCDGDVLWYMGNPGENKLPKFCWHCGGKAKKAL